jgi:hypothetical protein
MRRAQLGAAVILAGTIAACTDSAPPAGSVRRESLVAAASPTTPETTTLPEVTTTTEPEPVVTTTEAPTTTEGPYRPPTTRRAPVETTVAARASAGPTPPDYIKQCESGGDYRAVNPNGHYGAWQFSLSTWRSVGGTGNPVDASPAEQDYRAAILWANGAGASHWECA